MGRKGKCKKRSRVSKRVSKRVRESKKRREEGEKVGRVEV